MSVSARRDRLAIDIAPEKHREIKTHAALHGKTLKEVIPESVKTPVERDAERGSLSAEDLERAERNLRRFSSCCLSPFFRQE